MRYLCRQASLVENVKAFLVLDGPSTDHITAQALASKRFEVAFAGPGGHSWNDYGTPNPVHALSDTISQFVQGADARPGIGDRKARYSYNFGIIEGGDSINSIPASARAKLDLRSENGGFLEELSGLLNNAVERSVERENRGARTSRLTAKIKDLGARPGGKLPDDSPLLLTIQAVDSYLHIRSRIDCASTDANVPLSLGLPAISIGAGGQGGGAHTSQEWYQPEGRELGLRRILLALAALSDAEQADHIDEQNEA
jgi:di/tripeptidase